MNNKILIILLLTTFLSACSASNIDNILKAPKPSKDYVALQKEIDKKLVSGETYSAPEFGEYRNTVQLIDLDGDGENEALSFFRESKSAGKFNIYIHQKQSDNYVQIGTIKGTGTAIDSVSYPKISPTGQRAIVINWRLGRDITRGMSVAILDKNIAKTVLDTNHIDYAIADFDDDGIDEIITITDNINTKKANIYEFTENSIEIVGNTSLSDEVLKISKTKIGRIKGNIMAYFVESSIDETAALITDVLIYENGKFENITLDQDAGSRARTYRDINVNAEDVNRDGIVEIPRAKPFDVKAKEPLWILDWYSYSYNGDSQKVLSTYHNIAEGWMYELSEYWQKNIIATKKSDGNLNYISFEEYSSPILEIYAYVGDNREYYASQQGNIILAQTQNIIYCAKTPGNKVDIDELFKNFSLINPEEKIDNET